MLLISILGIIRYKDKTLLNIEFFKVHIKVSHRQTKLDLKNIRYGIGTLKFHGVLKG